MTSSKRLDKLYLASIVVVILATVYFFYDARFSTFFPKCPFFVLTGLYCPGCGSQRAASSLLHGDVVAALGFNLLFVLALPFVVYYAFVSFYDRVKMQQKSANLFYSIGFVKSVLVIVVVFWLLRNLHVYPFTNLAP